MISDTSSEPSDGSTVMASGIYRVHLAVWGDVVLSLPLLSLVIVPGGIYGLIFRMPRSGVAL
jgi:hypothetical protein